MIIILGADHAGYALKEKLKNFLLSKGYVIDDVGAKKLNKNDDYPDFALLVATRVADSRGARGILVCGSGAGVCVAANKVKNIRAVAVSSTAEAKLTRQHNDANVLCLSGWNLSLSQAQKIVTVWLKTQFSGEARHMRRLEKIRKMEQGNNNS